MYAGQRMSPEERVAAVEARKARGYPWHSPPHIWREDGGTFLITGSCLYHHPHFGTPARLDMLTDVVLTRLGGAGIATSAWVFQPTHYHLLAHAESFSNMAMALGKAHAKTSLEVNKLDGQRGRQVWYKYVDRRIRSDRHFWATVNYIHINPVKHGFARDIADWPWSTVHEFIQEHGRAWLDELAARYPVKDYGKGWDE